MAKQNQTPVSENVAPANAATLRRKGREELKRVNDENKKIMKAYYKSKKKRDIPESEYYLAQMKDPDNVVEFDNLHTYFYTDVGTVKAVSGASFAIPKGKTVGVVGESGCGKSVTSLSLMRLVQEPSGQIVEGEIRYNNGQRTVDMVKMPQREMQDFS